MGVFRNATPNVSGKFHGRHSPTPLPRRPSATSLDQLAPQRDDPYAPDVIGLFVDHRALAAPRDPQRVVFFLDVDFGGVCVCVFPYLSGWGLLTVRFYVSCVPLRVFVFVIRELLIKEFKLLASNKAQEICFVVVVFWFLMYFFGRNRLVIKRNLQFLENADFFPSYRIISLWFFERLNFWAQEPMVIGSSLSTALPHRPIWAPLQFRNLPNNKICPPIYQL